MKAVIFAGGDIKNYEAVNKYVDKYLSCADFLICADSGVRHALKMGIKPNLVVGDMDSISEEDLNKIKQMKIREERFPAEKDFTDTDLALKIALKNGATEAVVLAGIGDRPDHSLANILLMVEYKKKGMNVRLAGENWEMFLIEGQAEISGEKGDLLSLIPLSEEVVEIETKGLYYPLKKETIPLGAARGVSNIFLGEKAIVKAKEGLLIAVKISKDFFHTQS